MSIKISLASGDGAVTERLKKIVDEVEKPNGAFTTRLRTGTKDGRVWKLLVSALAFIKINIESSDAEKTTNKLIKYLEVKANHDQLFGAADKAENCKNMLRLVNTIITEDMRKEQKRFGDLYNSCIKFIPNTTPENPGQPKPSDKTPDQTQSEPKPSDKTPDQTQSEPKPSDKAPETQPQPKPSDKAPEIQPEPKPSDKAPETRPEPKSSDKTPDQTQPEPKSSDKAPETQPEPKSTDNVPGETKPDQNEANQLKLYNDSKDKIKNKKYTFEEAKSEVNKFSLLLDSTKPIENTYQEKIATLLQIVKETPIRESNDGKEMFRSIMNLAFHAHSNGLFESELLVSNLMDKMHTYPKEFQKELISASLYNAACYDCKKFFKKADQKLLSESLKEGINLSNVWEEVFRHGSKNVATFLSNKHFVEYDSGFGEHTTPIVHLAAVEKTKDMKEISEIILAKYPEMKDKPGSSIKDYVIRTPLEEATFLSNTVFLEALKF